MLSIVAATDQGLNTAVYIELRARLITGRLRPGHELSTRSLAAELNVSQTPVRDALARLAAEGAVEIRSKRRVSVKPMTPERFDDLLHCRLVLEPEAAALAMPNLDAAAIARLREIDAELDRAIQGGDPDAFMQRNHDFHFTIYRAAKRPTLVALIETLWLRSGPFMRVVHGNHAKSFMLDDQHRRAMGAIQTGDEQALRAAISADILDGMSIIRRAAFEQKKQLAAE